MRCLLLTQIIVFIMSNYNQQYSEDWMSVDAPQETYKPFVPLSYNTENDFGFGNMQATYDEDYENEPPLLEELGIDFSHIIKKIHVVLNPHKKIDTVLANDADLTGPILFCFILAILMLLRGRIQFGYTYGYFFAGCFLMFTLLDLLISSYILLNLLNESTTSISLTVVTSILGYSIIPLTFVSIIRVLFSTNNTLGYIIGLFCCLWSSYSASRFIEVLLGSKDQRLIIMYPLILLYATFTLITMF